MVEEGSKVGMKKNQSEGEGKGLDAFLEERTSAIRTLEQRSSHLSGPKRVQQPGNASYAFAALGSVIFVQEMRPARDQMRPTRFWTGTAAVVQKQGSLGA